MAQPHEEFDNSQPGWGMPKVRLLSDKGEIKYLLKKDRIADAYALANLEPGSFEKAEWYSVENDELQSLVMLHKAYEPNVFYSVGKEKEIAVILNSGVRNRELFFSIPPEHLPVVSAYYNVGSPETMIRMVVGQASFSPRRGGAVRLNRHQVVDVNNLYRTTLNSTITMMQIEEGIYFGVWEDNRLVSVAGTHFISPKFGIAAVGNVYTHPDYQGRGYATACTSAVTEALLQKVPDVVLNVNAKNDPALRVYTKLGYKEHSRLIEMLGIRKGTGHLRDVFKRFLTR